MNRVQYLFLDFQNTSVNYSFMLEKEACKQNESRIEYMFLEFSIPSEAGK